MGLSPGLYVILLTDSESTENDGEYLWDVSKTFRENSLTDSPEYHLFMSRSPTNQTSSSNQISISEHFTLSSNSSNPQFALNVAPGFNSSITKLSGPKTCYDFLLSNGGYYNHFTDPGRALSDFSEGFFTIDTIGREVINTASIQTKFILDVTTINTPLTLNNTNIDVISKSNLGMGTISLNGLQEARGDGVTDVDVVGMFLGSSDRAGSIVLGGYDKALIDQMNGAPFRKGTEHPSIMQLPLKGLTLMEDLTTTTVSQIPTFNVALSWDAYGLRLPKAYLDSIIPMIGAPVYDGSVGGFVYPSDEAVKKLKHSFVFTFNNGTADVYVTVPISSLMMTEFGSDNPLTPLQESGRKFLAISPTADGSTAGAYLGRRFLQHVYVVDSPETVPNFYMSTVPSEKLGKDLVPASSLTIFDGIIPGKAKTVNSRTGIIVAAVVGAFGLIVACLFILWLWKRGKKRHPGNGSFRCSSTDDMDYVMAKELGLTKKRHHPQPAPIAYRPKDPRRKRRRRGQDPSQPSMRTSETIEIRYSPSEKELDIPFSSPRGSRPIPPPIPSATLQPHIWTNHRSRQSEASTVAREVESISSNPSILEPSAITSGMIATHSPELSNVQFKHQSSAAQIISSNRHSVGNFSDFFEFSSLSPPSPRIPPPLPPLSRRHPDIDDPLSPLSSLKRQLSTSVSVSTVSALSETSNHSSDEAPTTKRSVLHTRTASLGKLLTPTTVEFSHGAIVPHSRSNEPIRSPKSPVSTRSDSAPPISAVEPTPEAQNIALPTSAAQPSPDRSSPVRQGRNTFYGPPEEPTFMTSSTLSRPISMAFGNYDIDTEPSSNPSDVATREATSLTAAPPVKKKKIKRSSLDKRLPRIPSPTMYDASSRESSLEIERPVVNTAAVAVVAGRGSWAEKRREVKRPAEGDAKPATSETADVEKGKHPVRSSSMQPGATAVPGSDVEGELGPPPVMTRKIPPPPPAPRRSSPPQTTESQSTAVAGQFPKRASSLHRPPTATTSTVPASTSNIEFPPPPAIPATVEEMRRESSGSGMILPLQIPSERNSEDGAEGDEVFGLEEVVRDGAFLRVVGVEDGRGGEVGERRR